MTEKTTPLVEAYRRDPEQFRTMVREVVRKLAALYERVVAEARLFLERLARAYAEQRRARQALQLPQPRQAHTTGPGMMVYRGRISEAYLDAGMDRMRADLNRQLRLQARRRLGL